jgi:halimadienyl-diphosphate synthase
MKDFQTLLHLANIGHMPSTAYDTAWIARLGDIDYSMSRQALAWISENQLPDGSWGTLEPFCYYDRVICTLAAILALTQHGRRAHDLVQVKKGVAALETISNGAGLCIDPNSATVGFELIVPTLVCEAESQGILAQQGSHILGRLHDKRIRKLTALRNMKIDRRLTAAFSAEMAGTDMQVLLDIPHLQETNGSVSHSPSATAYYALNVCHADPQALAYLGQVITADGGAPNVAPFDVFERAWILWNISQSGAISSEVMQLCQPHLDFLEQAWLPGKGIGWAAGYTPKDSDDSGLVWDVLARFGRSVDIETLFTFEEEECFRCFAFESNRSASANIHVLGALRQAGYPSSHPTVQKIARFLKQTQDPAGYWIDKWHASPYYSSAHAVMTCANYLPDLVQNTVQWLSETQKQDGAWGFHQSTAEETAYSLQALCTWELNANGIPKQTLQNGARWLECHQEGPFPALWIGKCLYLPELVVHSAVLSALEMVHRGV